MRHVSGTVTAFDDSLAFGEVSTERGETYFFHCTQIADGSRSIAVGTHVNFRVIAGRMGRWEAADVEPRHRPGHEHPTGFDAPIVSVESESFECPVCGAAVQGAAGDYEICQVCNWEDDPVQRNDPSYANGANVLSLDAARQTWAANHS